MVSPRTFDVSFSSARAAFFFPLVKGADDSPISLGITMSGTCDPANNLSSIVSSAGFWDGFSPGCRISGCWLKMILDIRRGNAIG
ncbi:hypothetical protein A2U01_0074398, partial [Trifolium medium]|nr:hypothetical protein [Trifolium medium]